MTVSIHVTIGIDFSLVTKKFADKPSDWVW
jgi:hypothetical protein